MKKKNPTFIRPQDIKWHRNQIVLLDSSPNGFFFFSCINYDNYKATKLFILGVMLHKCRTHSFSQLHSRLWSQLIIFCVYSCFIVRKNTGRLWAIDQLVMRFWLAAFSIIRPSTVASVCTGGGGSGRPRGAIFNTPVQQHASLSYLSFWSRPPFVWPTRPISGLCYLTQAEDDLHIADPGRKGGSGGYSPSLPANTYRHTSIVQQLCLCAFFPPTVGVIF